MSADVHPGSPNPCCALWIKRSQKLEKSRDALRQSVKILEGQIEKQILQIASLKKEDEEQKVQREQQKVERMKEDNIKKQLEKEIQDMKVDISSLESTKSLNGVDVVEIGMLKTRILGGEEEVKRLKELLEKERSKTDSERRKTETEKKKAAEAWKLLKEEKRKTQEQKCFVVAEQKKAEEFRFSMEKFKVEANEVREKLNAEIVRAHDAKKQIDVEKMKASGEKKRADSEMKKAEKQKRLFEEESKRALDLKRHADHLCLKLEEEWQKREGMVKKLEDMSAVPSFGERERNVCKTLKAAEFKLLKQQVKLERKRVKHAERVAKQEKYEKKFVMKEVHLLKQNLMQILYRLNLLDGLVSHDVESTGGALKVLKSSDWKGLKLNDLLQFKKDFNYEAEFGPSEIHHVGPFTSADPVGGECIGLPVSRGCCDRSKTGIISELESPVGGFLRNKSQSSAVCSTSMHFSDRKLMGSQGRDSVVDISTTKLAKKANHNLTVLESLGEVVKIGMHKSCLVVAKDSDRSASSECLRKQPCSNLPTLEAVDQVTDHKSKKRKIQSSSKSVAWLQSEDNRLHSNVGDKLFTINDQVRKVGRFALTNCSRSPAVFKDIDYEKFCQKGGRSDLCKMNDAHTMIEPSTGYQTEKQIVKLGNKKKTSKLVSKYNRVPCCNQVSGPDSYEFVINQATTSLGNRQADLTSFEKIISGEYLKLLELDNENDEERYRNAMDMPLSPTLPESEIHTFQLGEEDDSHALLEKDSLARVCSSDVMDLEINSSNSKSKILINKELSFNSVAHHVVLHDITHDSFLADNGGSLVLGHIDHARKPERPGMIPLLMETNTDRECHHLRHSLAEPNKIELEVIPISKVSVDTIAKGYKKAQPSTDAASGFSRLSHSQFFHEGERCESCALDNLDLAEHSPSCVGSLNKILGDCQPVNSNLIQIQPEVKTIDYAFAQNVNRIVPLDVKRLTKGSSFISEKDAEQNFQQPLHSLSVSEAAKPTPSFSSWEVKYLFEGNDEADPGRYLCYITSFSSARDVDGLSRILCALNAFTPENLTGSDIDLLLVDVLNGLKLEYLQSEEKVSVLFSFLVGNLSSRMSDHCKHIMEEDSFQFLESFSLEIVRAFSSGNTKHIFDEMFQLDILFWLMENFLIEREILVIGEIEQHHSCFSALPDYKFHLDVGNKCVHSKDILISQFLAGCTILASICVAADDIGYLLVVSYKILGTHQDDISWVLIALHAFANICGKRFFNDNRYSFLVTTIKSLISLLEGGLKPGSCPLPLCLNSTSGIVADFLPCKHCPFSMDAICMDKLIGLLLDVLEDYSLAESGYQKSENKIISSNGTLSSRATLNKDTDDGKSESDVHCDSSCAIFKYGKIINNQSGCFSAMAFCNFTDIISLVELVCHYVSWEWTFKEVMPRLLKMLENCIREDFSAALFVLVGELGRSCGGYQRPGVAELRCKVTKLLDMFIARKADLSTQFAAVGALINLLPLSFQDVLNKNQDFTLDSCESAHLRYIQKWVFQLDGEQRAALKNIFEGQSKG